MAGGGKDVVRAMVRNRTRTPGAMSLVREELHVSNDAISAFGGGADNLTPSRSTASWSISVGTRLTTRRRLAGVEGRQGDEYGRRAADRQRGAQCPAGPRTASAGQVSLRPARAGVQRQGSAAGQGRCWVAERAGLGVSWRQNANFSLLLFVGAGEEGRMQENGVDFVRSVCAVHCQSPFSRLALAKNLGLQGHAIGVLSRRQRVA